MRVTAADIVDAVKGRQLSGAPDTEVSGFSIDSRTLEPGDLYIAIQGQRLDGHEFVDDALDRGACGVLIGRPMPGLDPARLGHRLLIVAPDTTYALQRLARWVRRKSGARVVGITGSAGKTTTKEMAAAFLSLRHRVMRSSGNLNNHIGLPLSLLELRRGAEVAVVELGMNHVGEISRLVAIAEPDVRVWTNVAEVHIEFFGSLDAIADAKAEVLENARDTTVLVANADDPRVMVRTEEFPGLRVTFGASDGATVQALDIEDAGLDGTRALVRTNDGDAHLLVPLLGRGNMANALAAIGVGLQFGVPLADMVERAKTLRPALHRGEVMRLPGGVTVVDDAYNSNPRAVQGVLKVIAAERGFTRRVAVLGEMLELGEQSVALHETCGRVAAASGLSLLITVGGEPARALGRASLDAGLPATQVCHAETSEAAADLVAAAVRAGDLVLVKGSRGIRTERVVDRLAAEFG
jgi:UDP-N-acetylmuramoyl-tripeptide--D-alanyl-D-alanine ligase